MNDKTFTVNLITYNSKIIEDNVISLTVTTTSGRMGVLANHDNLIATILPSNLEIKLSSGHQKIYNVKEGIINIDHNKNEATLFLSDAKLIENL